jgi:predicted RNase H-like nuclease
MVMAFVLTVEVPHLEHSSTGHPSLIIMPNTPIFIGIDPAPSNKKHAVVKIEKGECKIEEKHNHSALRKQIGQWANESHILIGWDAPLTGPRVPDDDNAGENDGDFTKRDIEKCWKPPQFDHPPKGISVQGYAGCQHWTITRNLLGLPRVGPYDKEEIPFRLLTSNEGRGDYSKPSVVEVHPALAMWLWVKGEAPKDFDYRYKGKPTRELKSSKIHENRENLVNLLFQVWGRMRIGEGELWESLQEKKEICQKCPDTFDALVAAVLVYLWANEPSSVTLLGDAAKGSFLLPDRVDLPKL